MVLGMIIGVCILSLGFIAGCEYTRAKLREEQDDFPKTDNGLYSTTLLMRDAILRGDDEDK